MNLTEDAIRERCTDAVYERGENYLANGRIRRISRFDGTVDAVVSGGREYDLTLDLPADGFDPHCSCPYDGPGICKHVVAVLLRCANELPDDERNRIDPVLADADSDDLRAFLRDELATDPALRNRFLARFGEPTNRSVDDLRAEIDRLFEETNPEYAVVFEPIDFAAFFDLAEEHRAQHQYRSAATVYRALVEGLDDNADLVDGAHDRFATAFENALDGYGDCMANADLDAGESEECVQFLEERATSGTPHLRDRFVAAADELREEYP